VRPARWSGSSRRLRPWPWRKMRPRARRRKNPRISRREFSIRPNCAATGRSISQATGP
jgi:hypothetical protein